MSRKARLNALWWWVDRWRKSTAYMDMTLEEQGAYRNLLDEANLRGGAIPNDERILAKACGDATAWARVRPAVMARFELGPDGWHNRTLDDVLAESTRRAEKQAAWRNKRGNASGNKPGNKPGSPDPDPDLNHSYLRASQKGGPISAQSADAFVRFFAIYPNQEAKQRANQEWIMLAPDAELAEHIIRKVQERIALGWGDEPRFVPHASRFLKEQMWQERYVPRKPVAPKKPETDGRVVPDADATARMLADLRSARG